MQHFIQRKMWKSWYLWTFFERITVNSVLKNNHNNSDNKNEEKVEDEGEWEISEAVQMVRQ